MKLTSLLSCESEYCKYISLSPQMCDHSFKSVHVVSRGVKSQELDTPAIEKRFAYTFLQQLITYVDQAHQHMMEFGETLLCE